MQMDFTDKDYDEIADRLFERIATRLPPTMVNYFVLNNRLAHQTKSSYLHRLDVPNVLALA